MADFIHLHNHSDFSLLDGAASIPKLVNKAKEFDMKHLALTDHGNMFGSLKFYKECKKNDINPIIGSEFYVSPGSRFIKSGTDFKKKYHHLILLATNHKGYENLIELSSLSYTEGFYYKPRIDYELIEKYKEGLICTSACLAGVIPNLIIHGQTDKALEQANYLNEVFGKGNFYLELQDHGINEQKIANKGLIEISKKTDIPLIATNDIHYVERSHANAQDILICIGTNRKKNETNRMKFHGPEFYFKSPEEMTRLFSEVPEAIKNTVKIAEKCNLKIELPGPILPDYKIPEIYSTKEEYFKAITQEGLVKRYKSITPQIQERADFELDIIISMGFTGYFLIVWDFIHWAQEHNIPVGPGRGSGAGSIVAYALKITDIDPLKYELLFERFLNPERISMPDFDIDFCFERRQEVIDYVTEKYGKEKVGQIITFGTLKPKAVVKDVARVLDIPFAESNEITKIIPDGPKIKLKEAIESEKELKAYSEKGDIYKELIETGLILEGLNRHSSTHAAGVVIGKEKLTKYVPLYRDSKTGQVSTQFTMDQLEECGLVKMDFLGLKTLTLIQNTSDLIKKRIPDFNIEEIPEDDEKTFTDLGNGKSTCIFQFESSGMQGILKQAKPNSIEDLIALNALYRPGPMQYIPQFIDSKSGKTPISYPDKSLIEILKPTYGVIVYQEQVMKVAQIIGGFSLGKADILRRAMGKKKVAEMDKLKIEFIAGAKEKGFPEKKADDIFEMLKPFAGYGFNKSHAAAYSVLAYKTAYLKSNYPAEFMAANLTNEINSPDKLPLYINESQKMGLEILPPKINYSEKNFTVVDGKIVYGLMGVKNVGSAAVEEIISKRKSEGTFTSFIDFLEKVDLKVANKKVLETIIQCGLFDDFNETRASLFNNFERIQEFVNIKKESEKFGQNNLFDAPEHEEFHKIEIEKHEEWPQIELLRFEKEFLGFYFSGHPMDDYRETWNKSVNLNLKNIEKTNPEKTYTILGMIKTLREIITKKGKKMAFATLEDFNGSTELVFFPDTWEKNSYKLALDEIVGIKGTIEKSRGEPKILVKEVLKPEELEEINVKEVHIKLAENSNEEEDLYAIRSFLITNAGDCTVYLHIRDKEKEDKEIIIKVNPQIKLNADENILEDLKLNPKIEDVWKE